MQRCLFEKVTSQTQRFQIEFCQREKNRNITFLNSQRRKQKEKKFAFFQKESQLNVTNFHRNSKSKSFQFKTKERNTLRQLKVQIKNVLMRMNYKEKLKHILVLLQQAKQLCGEYGFFQVTPAMIFYNPHQEIKLSMWIHPNLKQIYRMHPINKGTLYQRQCKFIQSLNYILKRLFPTISLGNHISFDGLEKKLIQLENQRKKKLQQFQEEQRTKKWEQFERKLLKTQIPSFDVPLGQNHQAINQAKEGLSIIQEISQSDSFIFSYLKTPNKTWKTDSQISTINSPNSMSQCKQKKSLNHSLCSFEPQILGFLQNQLLYFTENDELQIESTRKFNKKNLKVETTVIL